MSAAEPVALAPDPALPHRDALLDADAMAERLSGALGSIDSCRRERARYAVGQRLWVIYRVGHGERERLVVAHTFADAAAAGRVFARAAVSAPPPNGMRSIAHDRELHAVMWAFPYDPRMAMLPALVSSASPVGELLGRPVETRVVAYRPVRRAVLRCVDATGADVAYAKVYHDDRGARVARAQEELVRLLADDPDVRVPRVLAFSAEKRTLVVEPISAPALSELRGERLEWGAGRLGAALARLHDVHPPARLRSRAPTPAQVRALVEPIALMRPDARVLAEELLDALLDRWPRYEGTLRCAHGDVNTQNARVDQQRVALIDLDDLALAPPGKDLARVLGRVRVDRLLGYRTPAETGRLEAALLAGYGEVRQPPPDDTLGWHTALDLAGYAAKAVTRVNADFARHLAPLLGAAREALG